MQTCEPQREWEAYPEGAYLQTKARMGFSGCRDTSYNCDAKDEWYVEAGFSGAGRE
jgi:hypothetical protein